MLDLSMYTRYQTTRKGSVHMPNTRCQYCCMSNISWKTKIGLQLNDHEPHPDEERETHAVESHPEVLVVVALAGENFIVERGL